MNVSDETVARIAADLYVAVISKPLTPHDSKRLQGDQLIGNLSNDFLVLVSNISKGLKALSSPE